MAVRTLAVQVSEELFARFKTALAKKGCKQKDFLIEIIEKAVEEIEKAEMAETKEEAGMEEEPEGEETQEESEEEASGDPTADMETEDIKE